MVQASGTTLQKFSLYSHSLSRIFRNSQKSSSHPLILYTRSIILNHIHVIYTSYDTKFSEFLAGPRRPGPGFDSTAALPRTPTRGEGVAPGSGVLDQTHHAGYAHLMLACMHACFCMYVSVVCVCVCVCLCVCVCVCVRVC